jgi:hypothetical protein
MAPPLYAQHGSAPLCAAWLRHDTKMLVTPRAPDAIWGMAADKPLRSRGAVKAASKTDTAKGWTRPAPLFSPLGRKRREAIAHAHLCRPHHLGAQPGPVLWPATTKAKPHTDVRDEKIPH